LKCHYVLKLIHSQADSFTVEFYPSRGSCGYALLLSSGNVPVTGALPDLGPCVPVCSGVIAGMLPESLRMQEENAGLFLSSVLKACMSPGGGRSRVHALSLLVSWKTYREIVQSLRSDSGEEWDYM